MSNKIKNGLIECCKNINKTYVAFAFYYILSMSICLFFPWAIKHLTGLTAVSFGEHFEAVSNISDVNSYIAIAENGYVTTGDARFQLVFFPFYPLLIKVVHIITGLGYRAAATFISFVSAYGASVALYKLMRLEYCKDKAYNIVKVFLIYPFIFFTFTRMGEALYLLLLFTTIYLLRKERYLIAGVFGFMTATTRKRSAYTEIALDELGECISRSYAPNELVEAKEMAKY